MSRLIWAAVIVAVIGTIATWMLIPRGVPVETALAVKKTIREYVEERAKTRLPSIQRITMPLQGRILPIVLQEGDTVQVGQIVAVDVCRSRLGDGLRALESQTGSDVLVKGPHQLAKIS